MTLPSPDELIGELRPVVLESLEAARAARHPHELEAIGADMVPALMVATVPTGVVEAAVAIAEAQPGSRALLAAAAAAAPPPLATLAGAAARRLGEAGEPLPPAARRVGGLSVAEAWRYAAHHGHEAVICSCTRPGRRDRQVIAAMTEPAAGGGRALGAVVMSGPEPAGSAGEGLTPIAPGEAAHLVAEAVRGNLRAGVGPEADAYSRLPLLVRALGIPEGEELLAAVLCLPPVDIDALDPDEEDLRDAALEAEADALAGELEAWLGEAPVGDDLVAVAAWMGEAMFQARAAAGARPGEWTPDAVEDFLLDVAPRRLLIDPPDVPAVPEAVAVVLEWLATTGRADAAAAAASARRAREIAPRFAEAVADPAGRGPAARFIELMMADGVDPSDPAAVQAWVEAWNALPESERRRRLPIEGRPPAHPSAGAERARGAVSRERARKRRSARDVRRRNRGR